MSEREDRYTQGPWEVKGEDEVAEGVPCIVIGGGDGSKKIAYVVCSLSTSEWAEGAQLTDSEWRNAYLIGAAPKLLEALKELVSIVEIHSKATGSEFAWAELPDARRAIAEAHGVNSHE